MKPYLTSLPLFDNIRTAAIGERPMAMPFTSITVESEGKHRDETLNSATVYRMEATFGAVESLPKDAPFESMVNGMVKEMAHSFFSEVVSELYELRRELRDRGIEHYDPPAKRLLNLIDVLQGDKR